MRQEETVEDLKRLLNVEREDMIHVQHELECVELRLDRLCRDRDRINESIRSLERRLEERQIRDSYAEIEIAYLELKATLSPGGETP